MAKRAVSRHNTQRERERKGESTEEGEDEVLIKLLITGILQNRRKSRVAASPAVCRLSRKRILLPGCGKGEEEKTREDGEREDLK